MTGKEVASCNKHNINLKGFKIDDNNNSENIVLT
jgi:hypothetical protein